MWPHPQSLKGNGILLCEHTIIEGKKEENPNKQKNKQAQNIHSVFPEDGMEVSGTTSVTGWRSFMPNRFSSVFFVSFFPPLQAISKGKRKMVLLTYTNKFFSHTFFALYAALLFHTSHQLFSIGELCKFNILLVVKYWYWKEHCKVSLIHMYA